MLVVDDEAMIRYVIAEALREVGYEVRTAGNGAEGLEILRRWLADVVVLDLMMPRLDGVGFIELVRLNPRLASLPILLVTAAYGGRDAERVGAQAVLTKPFELDTVVETVMQLAGAPTSAVDDAAARKRRSSRPRPPMGDT